MNSVYTQLINVDIGRHTWNIRWKYVLVKDDEVLDQFVHQTLILKLISIFGNWHERRTKANGNVVCVHHVLVTEDNEKKL